MPLPTPGYFLGVPTNLYGPVPTPGVPSTLFVDLLNTQTAAGDKTWTGLQTITRPAQVGVAEMALAIGTADGGAGRLSVENTTAANGFFSPFIKGTPTAASAGLAGLRMGGWVDTDTGTVPATRIDGANGSGSALTTRPPIGFFNGATLLGLWLANSSSFALQVLGAGFRVPEGANAKQGVATLVAGTVTVANTNVTANSRIFLTGQDNNTTGSCRISARVAATSFTITSNNAGDTGVVAYEIFEPS